MPQGNVLGGGSSVNAAIYIRGQRSDYDGWAQGGAEGWSYADVLPYFRRAEDNDRMADDYHGTGGPLGVSDLRQITDLTRALVRGAQQAGIPFTHDFNGLRQRGVGFNQTDEGAKAAQATMASSVMNPVFQSAFNVVKGSVPARTDVPNDAFDDCGKKGMADLAEASASGGLFGSMAHGHAAPASVKNALYDVVTAQFNGEYADGAAAATALAAAVAAAQ
jgi:choline dehydrogenase-like flavoprotein